MLAEGRRVRQVKSGTRGNGRLNWQRLCRKVDLCTAEWAAERASGRGVQGKLGPEGKTEKSGHAQEILIPWQIQTGVEYNTQFVSLSHIQASFLLAKT
jgi:hypothetical protein